MNLSCALCGISGPQVRPFLVEWAEPIGNRRFDVMPRCSDVAECRARVEQQGEPWPLVETDERKTA
jgi:hypothetical protein